MNKTAILALFLGSVLGQTAAGVTWPTNATIVLTLLDGVAPRPAGAREGCDVELELTVRNAKLEPAVWGYAVRFNRADHEGVIEKQETDGDRVKLQVRLRLNKDKWHPPTPGEALYSVELKQDGGTLSGTYRGTFEVPGKDGSTRTAVQGEARGQFYPLWQQRRAGFKELEANEHPRLIFRKADLPVLRKRMETPEGKAILARFFERLDKDMAGNQKNKPMFPAGYALAYQLTGEKRHAERAKELLAGMFGLGGSQDIHFGPQALGMALTLDMCYDAWDAEFRQQVIDRLAERTQNLFLGRGIGTYAPNPWHNHNGVRASSCGVAALALLGEKTADGKDALPDASRIIHVSARDVRRYFEFGGVSRTGWCLEGSFYKSMTWNSGPGHFVHAYRTALGSDPLDGYPDARGGAYAILGDWMEQAPGDNLAPAFGIGDHQTAGLWPVGLAIVPGPLQAGARWLFDHAYGLAGDKTFAIQWAYTAGYLLAGYPFDVAAQPPAVSLPWAADDRLGGHYIFRRPWKGAADTLLIAHLRSFILSGCHNERSGRTMDLSLTALGRQWIGGPLREDVAIGNALPPLGFGPGGLGNATLGGKTTYYDATADGKAVLSINLDEPFFEPMPKDGKVPEGARVFNCPRAGNFLDRGIRCQRYLALDTSGDCGAPVLLVILDRIEAESPRWALGLAREAGPIQMDGPTAVAGSATGANLKATFIAPANVKLEGGLTATGGKEYFVVLTVQAGVAPEVKVEGQGSAAKVRIGKRQITFDGQKIVLGE